MKVEIMVQRNARPAIALREVEYLRIFSALKSDLTSV